MKLPDHRRYRSPSRWLWAVLMTAAGVAVVLLSGVWYTAVRRPQLTAIEQPLTVSGAQELTLTTAQKDIYGIESAARALDEEGQPTGYLLITAANGYKSRIRVQTVFAPDKHTVASVRVLYQQETEYLGTRITGEGFLSQFAGRLAPMRLWTVPVEGSPIDGISGSTISSQAVVDAVNNAHRFLQENGDL